MNSSSMQTNLVLDGLFALLTCGKCKETPERPVRFIRCGHFFCDTCVENDTVCRRCDTPVEPCEKRPHYTVAQLINYCKTIKEMITDLDVGDLWPLANAIHRFTDEQSELAEGTEPHRENVTEPVQRDERLDEINSEPESAEYVESTQRQIQKKTDTNTKNLSAINPSAKSQTRKEKDSQLPNSKRNSRRLEESSVQLENESSSNSKEIVKSREENYLQPENGSFINSTEIGKGREVNYLQPENESTINSSQVDRIRKGNDVWSENVSFVHSTQIIKARGDGEAEAETPGYIDPTQISPIHKDVDFESETPGYINPTQAFRLPEESNLDSETPGYRYPTPVSQRRSERYMSDETAGYIDPTPDNRSHRSSETEPNTVPETEPSSTRNWQDDMELEIAEKDLFSPIPESNADGTLAPETLEMEVSFCERDVIPETFEVDPPIVSNARDSPRKSEVFADRTLAKQRMRTLQRKTYPMSDYDTVGIAAESASKSSTRLHRRLTDSALDSRTTNSIGYLDSLSFPDVRDPYMENLHENEEAGRLQSSSFNKRRNTILMNDNDSFGVTEAPSKQLRRIKDSELDRQGEILSSPRGSLNSGESRDFTETERIRKPGGEFTQTMSMDDERDASIKTAGTVEEARSTLQSRMRDGIFDRGTVSIVDKPDTSRRAAKVEKEKPVKHLRRLSSWEIELRKRALNSPNAMEIPLPRNDAEDEKVAPVEQLRRLEDPKVGRPNETLNYSRDRLDIANLRDFDTEPEETVEATSINNLARIKDLAMDRMNKDSMSDRDTLLFTNGGHLAETMDFGTEYIEFGDENSLRKRRSRIPTADHATTKTFRERESSIKNSASPERGRPRQLGRLMSWPLNRRNAGSTNDSDTVDTTAVGGSETDTNSGIRPLRRLKRPQSSKPGNRSMRRCDLHGVDITNIQDFDSDKLLNEPSTNDSDTANVDDVGDLLMESEKIPETRASGQLKRLQTPKPVRHSIIPSDVRGVEITNIEDFAKDRATLRKNSSSRGQNSLIKRSSKIPTDVRKSMPVASVAASVVETSGQAPLKQLRSVENLENFEARDKIPAKRAKAKIVQLKPRRRTIDKSTPVPKTMPKNVNKRNAKGETLLHTGCIKGQNDYVKALLEAGANPNTKDNASWTPLQEAVKLGRREICEMLLQFGASPNTPGIENRTALHDASQNDKLAEATLLLRFNASRNVYDKYGKKPIDYAVSDEMRALLSKDNTVERMVGEAACLNTTLDLSILIPNAKVVVLPSNLSTANKKALSHVASKLKIAVATSFRPGVTHIVVEANERNTTELSHHVILAILRGIWILNSQWIAISADLNDISEIDLELFEVHGAPNPGTPERSRMNEEKQNPRLFNNCFFYFTIGVRGTWSYGKLEFTKASLTTLVLAGQGEILKREPDPEDVKDNAIIPFHVAHKPIHPLHRCSHYIIYMPGKDEPRIKYNMPHIKTLPLAWLVECIEKFALVDPILIGIS